MSGFAFLLETDCGSLSGITKSITYQEIAGVSSWSAHHISGYCTLYVKAGVYYWAKLLLIAISEVTIGQSFRLDIA